MNNCVVDASELLRGYIFGGCFVSLGEGFECLGEEDAEGVSVELGDSLEHQTDVWQQVSGQTKTQHKIETRKKTEK